MGKQSARLYFQGKDHKDIYYNGHYHDAMYLTDGEGNATLVWEKLKKVPLEGFTAICYYNAYYYVVYCQSFYLSKDMVIYQGETLNKLEHAYTIKGISNIAAGEVVFWADKTGFTIAEYEDSPSKAKYYFYHFEYQENKKLDVLSYSGNDYSINKPINIAWKGRLYFLYKRVQWFTATDVTASYSHPVLIGQGSFIYSESGVYMDTRAVFASENKIIFPIMDALSPNPTLAESVYIYILTKDLDDGELELNKIEIPHNVINLLYNEVLEAYDKKHPSLSSDVTKENAVITYNLHDSSAVSNGYLMFQNMPISTRIRYFGYTASMDYRADVKINLKNLSIVSFELKDKDNPSIESGFATDEGFLSKFRGTEYSESEGLYKLRIYIRYILLPDHDFTIYIRDIKNIEILGKNEEEIEDKLYFTSSYRKEKNVYFSIQRFNNYLLEINLEKKTGAIIKPELYLKEG